MYVKKQFSRQGIHYLFIYIITNFSKLQADFQEKLSNLSANTHHSYYSLWVLLRCQIFEFCKLFVQALTFWWICILRVSSFELGVLGIENDNGNLLIKFAN